jgi:glucose/arabinose dehydrogenase
MQFKVVLAVVVFLVGGSICVPERTFADYYAVRTGATAFGDWTTDAPGVRRKITAADMPEPMASRPIANFSRVFPRPADALPKVPPGFAVNLFASGLKQPRVVRVAPNGDIFISESAEGRVIVMRADDGAPTPSKSEVFAANLNRPFGIAFYPPGPDPQFVYVATNVEVVRFPYKSGDLIASGPVETVVPALPAGGVHWTRDIVFSADGKTMFVSVGSASNVGEGMPALASSQLASVQTTGVAGATWGPEQNRADVLAFDPDGRNMRVFASGLRNCSGLAIQPDTTAVWCAVNERDMLGDDLPPDFATSVTEGGFYGWPWYYIGDHQDPRHKLERPDLATKVTLPDVLIQPHSAPLGITFYESSQFPADFKGDAFVALHGSWNRAKRTGYKVVRLIFKDGRPTGEYEDFLVGFSSDDGSVWGRPVDVAVTRDGALLVTDDGGGVVWRAVFTGDLRARGSSVPLAH